VAVLPVVDRAGAGRREPLRAGRIERPDIDAAALRRAEGVIQEVPAVGQECGKFATGLAVDELSDDRDVAAGRRDAMERPRAVVRRDSRRRPGQ
jgi:hypothetical protein